MNGGIMLKQDYEGFMHDQLTFSKKLLSDYRQIGMDETELIVVLQLIRYQQENNLFPTPSDIAAFTNYDDQVVSRSLRQLMQKHLMSIEESENGDGIVDEFYSLEPLWQALYAKREADKTKPTDQSVEIFKQFEREFGRVLSPIEIETINIWLDEDQYDVKLIQQALREAVLLSKLNFKYVDRILQEWQKKGIKTVDAAKQAGKKFHQQSSQRTEPARKRTDPSVYYNWLDEPDD